MDADKTAESLENPHYNTPLDNLSEKIVEVLLDISEENLREQEAYEIPKQSSWDEAIQGWGRCSSFSCLFIAHQKGKKQKPETSSSHCVLCTEIVPSHASSEASDKISEEPLSKVCPSLQHLNRTPSTITSTSSDGEPSDIARKDRSIREVLLESKLLFGPEQFTLDKLLSHLPHPDASSLDLKNRNAGKVALLGRLMVLPPVKVPTNSNPNSKNSVFSRREYNGRTTPVISEKAGVDGDQEESVLISYSSPPVGTPQGSLLPKQGPTQHQYQLSALSNSRRYQIPNNTMAETQPSANSLPEQNLKQEVPIRSHAWHSSGRRSRLALKEKRPRRAEPELPILLGTRIQVPTSAHRLL